MDPFGHRFHAKAYTRTLRLPDPGLAEGQIWIRERQRDLCGYREFG